MIISWSLGSQRWYLWIKLQSPVLGDSKAQQPLHWLTLVLSGADSEHHTWPFIQELYAPIRFTQWRYSHHGNLHKNCIGWRNNCIIFISDVFFQYAETVWSEIYLGYCYTLIFSFFFRTEAPFNLLVNDVLFIICIIYFIKRSKFVFYHILMCRITYIPWSILQRRLVLILQNIPRYCIKGGLYNFENHVRYWLHKITSMPRPHRKAIRCLYLGYYLGYVANWPSYSGATLNQIVRFVVRLYPMPCLHKK